MYKKILFMTQAALIAALYVVITYFVAAFNLASGAIQIRISEALTILPFFTPAAIPGLGIGCLLANIMIGSAMPDIIFGTLATLIGAVGTYVLRKHKFIMTLSPVITNMAIIPFVLRYAYGMEFVFHGVDLSIPFYALTVGVGEVISCCILGTVLVRILGNYKGIIFKPEIYDARN